MGEGRVRVESYAEAWNQLAIGNICHEVTYTLVGSAANLAVRFLAVIAKTERINFTSPCVHKDQWKPFFQVT